MSWRLVSGKAVQPPSGKKLVQNAAQPTKDLLAFTVDRPTTPEELKQFRTINDVGAKNRLPTNVADLPVDDHFVFGVRTSKSDKAADVLQPQVPRLQQEEIERKEAIFNHTPIGRAKRNPANLPEWLAEKEGQIAFGAPPQPVEPLVLFATPPETPSDKTATSILQPQSTKSRPGAGVPVKRYDEWAVDPLTTVFGAPSKQNEVNVAKTLEWTTSGVQNPEKPSRRIKKELPFDAVNATFGVKTPILDDAKEIIHSTPEAARAADDNIGKSKSAEFVKANGLENTAFGVASRREQKLPPEHNKHSIQPTAAKPSFQTHTSDTVASVLSPSKNKSAYQGAWSAPRPKEELKDIVLSAINVSEQDFEAAYQRALAGSSNANSELSVTDIQTAITKLQLERHQQRR